LNHSRTLGLLTGVQQPQQQQQQVLCPTPLLLLVPHQRVMKQHLSRSITS
jgi:hypothetical protein